MNDLLAMRELIREKTGIHFRDDLMFSLEASVKRRMDTVGCGTMKQYLSKTLEDKIEMDALINLITVNETYFMREPSHFSVLTEMIFPEISKRKKPGQKIRFLSAGCSTGEEAFSIAMSLVDKYGESILDTIEVFGVDIDHNVISSARTGIYKGHSFRAINSRMRDKYFIPRADAGQGAYGISDSLKKAVTFQILNLFDKSYPSQLTSMDVIFYRNVSIYFSGDVQKEIFRNLSKLLVDEGCLFLSSSETYFHNIGILFLREMQNAFVYRKRIEIPVEEHRVRPAALLASAPARTQPAVVGGAKAPPAAAARLSAPIPPKAPPRAEDRRDSHALFDEALVRAVNKEYPAALIAVKSILEKDAKFKKAHSLKASILLNMQNIGLAEETAKTLLTIDEWDVEGLMLLGIIEKTKEADNEAVRQFKKAIYIAPRCWLAHFYLGELYFGMDDLRGAAYEYSVVASIIERDGGTGHGLTYFPLSFPPAHLARLCRQNIDKISRGFQKKTEA